MRCWIIILGVFLFLRPLSAASQVVISEVMWAGSDLSTSDEWLEIANPSGSPVDVSGWSLTYLKSTGVETKMATFGSGTVILPEQYFLVGSKHEADSRLAREPDLFSSSLVLPNTKLLIRLKDRQDLTIDQVDDGVGNPFAGANPSGTGAKASMERIDLLASGSLESNWRSAAISIGFDAGAHLFGSPGFANGGSLASASLSASSCGSADPLCGHSSSVSSASSESSVSSSLSTSSDSSCFDPLIIAINVQSGELTAVDHTTINFEAVATSGTLSGLTCQWSFSDGFTSGSCNPSSHAFTNQGITIVNLTMVNHCGNTLKQSVNVQVIPSGSSSSAAFSQSIPYDGSKLIISGVLPNPAGADTGKEWIELKNVEDYPLALTGFTLVLGEETKKVFQLAGNIDPDGFLKIWNSEMKFTLKNTDQTLRLVAPNGDVLSTVSWESPEEGRVYLPSEIRSLTVRGTVARVIDGDTIDLAVDPDAARALGKEIVRVRLLGVDTPELFTDTGVPQPFAQDASEFLRALVEGKRVELEFDTDLWDKYGRLLAYVYMDGGVLVEDQLLVNGLAKVMHAFKYRRKDLFLDLEARARDSKIGLWSWEQDSALTGEETLVRSGSASSVNNEGSKGIGLADPVMGSSVYISEIFPSPDSHATAPDLSGEWIELGRHGTESLSLSGWTLAVGKRSRTFDSRMSFGSGAYLLVNAGDWKLQLPNAGGTVALRSPDGSVLLETQYPALKIGQSYVWDESSRSFCVSTPTPLAENQCIGASPPPKRVSTAAKRTIAYAASYREQTAGPAGETISLPDTSPADDISASWILFMTIPGVAVGVLVTVLGTRMRWVRVD